MYSKPNTVPKCLYSSYSGRELVKSILSFQDELTEEGCKYLVDRIEARYKNNGPFKCQTIELDDVDYDFLKEGDQNTVDAIVNFESTMEILKGVLKGTGVKITQIEINGVPVKIESEQKIVN